MRLATRKERRLPVPDGTVGTGAGTVVAGARVAAGDIDGVLIDGTFEQNGTKSLNQTG